MRLRGHVSKLEKKVSSRVKVGGRAQSKDVKDVKLVGAGYGTIPYSAKLQTKLQRAQLGSSAFQKDLEKRMKSGK